MDVLKVLLEESDALYADFTASLVPTVDKDRIIGVRAPRLHSIAKRLCKSGEWRAYTKLLPHGYHDEDMLHAFIINEISSSAECKEEIIRFLPYVDNWAVCDSIRPRALFRNEEMTREFIDFLLTREHTYARRLGIEFAMRNFLGERFEGKYADVIAAIRTNEYYLNMAVSWYFAEALAKNFDVAVKYIADFALSIECHNKAISKARESYRISDEKKAFLWGLRRTRAK